MARNRLVTVADAEGWVHHHGNVFRCPVYLSARDGGGFTATAAVLPGVRGHGTTEAEALSRVTEALRVAIAAHKATAERVPWLNPPLKPEPGAVTRWVFPHV